MFGISFAELMIVFLLVLVVMGPEKLPQVARWTGKGLRELRKASNTLRGALEMEDLDTGPTSSRPRPRQLPDKSTSPSSNATAPGPSSTGSSDEQAAPDPVPPPTGLDQVDDADFEKMLEEQYAARHGGRHGVELAPRQPSSQRTGVAIPPRRPSEFRAVTELPAPTHGGR